MRQQIKFILARILTVCVFCQIVYVPASAENWHVSSVSARNMSKIIPSSELWGVSESSITSDEDRVFKKCKVGNSNGLRTTDMQIGKYSMNVYFVFGKNMGTYSGLSKVAYILSNSGEQTSQQLTRCCDNLTKWMRAVLGDPDSESKSVTTWETKECTVQIGKGKFKEYTGNKNSTIAIVIKGKSFPEAEGSSTKSPQVPASGLGRETMQTQRTDHFIFSVPTGWSHKVENGQHGYTDKNEREGLLVGETEVPALLDYSDQYIIRAIKDNGAEILHNLSTDVNVGTASETNINGLSAVMIPFIMEGKDGYMLVTYDKQFIFYSLYIKQKEYSINAYDSAMKCFQTVRVIGEKSDDSIPTSIPEISESDIPSDDESSQFNGAMVTVQVGGKKVKIHKAFKDLMDSYEAFFSSYLEALSGGNYFEFFEIIGQYAEMAEALEELEDADLTSAELAYYLETYARIMSRLAMLG